MLNGNAVKHFELPISEKSAYSRSISPKSMRADSVLTNKFSVQNASQRWLNGLNHPEKAPDPEKAADTFSRK